MVDFYNKEIMEPQIINIYNKKKNEYKNRRGNCIYDTVIKYVLEQKNLKNAIIIAAYSHDKYGKKHSHQRRLENDILSDFGEILVSIENKINDISDFDSLISIIDKHKINGVGEMLVYDVALRIGHYKRIYPEKIYLHRGTRVGVENLLGRKVYQNTILKEQLPEPFKSCDLTASQLEDFFCIYEDIFSNNNKQVKGEYKFC